MPLTATPPQHRDPARDRHSRRHGQAKAADDYARRIDKAAASAPDGETVRPGCGSTQITHRDLASGGLVTLPTMR